MADIKSILGKLTDLTQLDTTPEAYFEAALESVSSYHDRLMVLVAYGRYLIETGQADLAQPHLDKAKEMAEKNNLTDQIKQINALLRYQAEPVSAPESEQTINGRYILHEEVGRGGMGIVYRATDRLTSDTVALKRIKTDATHTPDASTIFEDSISPGTDEALRLALAQEFQILAGLRHPHIVSVLGYGFDEEQHPFLVMEYLADANPITAVVESHNATEKGLLVLQTIQALVYLHRRGVLHRDIKPSNILVSNGRVKLVDFGLSDTEQQHNTLSGGTLLYMAPEIYHQSAPYNATSDLYSLGVVMYQLLMGVHPFERIIADSPDNLIDAIYDFGVTELPQDLNEVMQTLLGKEQDARYQTAQFALGALSQALGQEKIETAEIRESFLQAAKFVGREPEMKQLHQALKDARQGNGSAWLIGGESGVGKSRFVEEFRIQALVSGWQVIRGQAHEGRGKKYQLWQDLVPYLALNSELSDLEAGILQDAFPKISQLISRPIQSPPELNGADAQQRLAITLASILQRQKQPTLLLLEDLHWAHEGLILLNQIIRVQEQMPHILVVATYRNDERPQLPEEVADTQNIILERLEGAEIDQLAQAMLGGAAVSPDIITALSQETEGNTFFMVEVLRAYIEEVGQITKLQETALPTNIFTTGMADLMQRRINKISQRDKQILQFAAVYGRRLDLQLLAHLTPTQNIDTFLQSASGAAILIVQNDAWLFSHDKLRQATLAQLTAEERKEIHRDLAKGIEQIYSDDSQYDPILLKHWQVAGNQEKELQYLLPVVKQLIEFTADYRRGHELADRGLDILSTADARRIILLNQKVDAYLTQAQFDKATATANQALSLAQLLKDETGQAISLNQLGEVLFEQAQYRQAEIYFQQSLSVSEAIENKKHMARSLLKLGSVAEFQKNYDQAETRFKQSLVLYQEIEDTQGLLSCYFYLGMLAAQYHGDYEASFAYDHQALVTSQETGYQRSIARAHSALGIDYGAIGNYQVAIEHLEQNLSLKQEIGYQIGIGHAYLILGELHYFQGVNFDQVIVYQEQAIEILQKIKSYTILGIAHGYYILSHAKQGNYSQALDKALTHFELYSTIELDKSNGLVHVAMANILRAMDEDSSLADRLQETIHQVTKLTQLEANPIAYIEKGVQSATISQIRMEVLIEAGSMAIDVGKVDLARTYLTEARDQAEQIGNQHKSDRIEALVNQLSTAVAASQALQVIMGNQEKQTINGRYILHEEIGRGGMGIVYRATDRLTGDIVALKQITTLSNDAFGTTFSSNAPQALRLALTQEFQILAGLRHPYIVSVLDYGFVSVEKPYFTMTYLGNAKPLLSDKQEFSTTQVFTWVSQLLQSLTYLHRRGILHKDLKPSNILLVDGEAKILDFGLATTQQQKIALTGGTARYMAPEVYQAISAYTASAELYALGLITYQLLSGVHPLDTQFDFDRLDLPTKSIEFVKTLLEQHPENRYSSAEHALHALYQALGHAEPIESQTIRESFLQTASFVGRQKELNLLNNTLVDAKAGNSSVVLLGGESGVGKSRLMDQLRITALVSGWKVISGQTAPQNRVPYQLWRNVVSHLILNVELSDLEAGVLKQIVPHIDQLLGRYIPNPPEVDRENRQQRLIFTLTDVLQRQTEPVLLLLEDLHWAYEGMEVITHLLAIIEQISQVVIIGSYRHDEAPQIPNRLPKAQAIILDRLADTQIEALSQAILGEQGSTPHVVDLLKRETEGNTLFIIEVLRALAEEAGQLGKIGQMALPAEVFTHGMQSLLQRRLQKVSSADLKLLQVAAIIGRQLDTSLLRQISSDENLSLWLQRNLERSILDIREGAWQFAHDKLREVILDDLDQTEKKRFNQIAAEAIEAVYPHNSDYDLALLNHWAQAGNLEKELHYLLPVVQKMVDYTADYQEAARLIERGLAIVPERDTRRVTLGYIKGRQLSYQANYDEALAICKQNEALAHQLDDKKGLVLCLMHTGTILHIQGDYRLSLEIQTQSLALSQELGDTLLIAANLASLGHLIRESSNLDEAKGYLQQALDIYRQENDQRGITHCLRHLASIAVDQDQLNYAQILQEQNLGLVRQLGDRRNVGSNLLMLGIIHRYKKSYQQAIDCLQEATDLYVEISHRMGAATTLNNMARISYLQEDYEQAIVYGRQTLVIREEIGYKYGQVFSLLILGFSHMRLHRPEAAEIFCRAMKLSQEIESYDLVQAVIAGFAWLYQQRGNLHSAAELIGLIHWVDADSWLEGLRESLAESLGEEAMQRAIQESKEKDLNQVAKRLLQEFSSKDRAELETINGRYILHEEIGRGGMGVVYRATDRLSGNIVALKQIKISPESGSRPNQKLPELSRDAFAREFQIVAGLRHPHIVSVLDYGFDSEQEPYFTMDYLPQVTTILEAARTLDADEKLDLINQVLQALAYLHRRGIWHKDIKPNNILVSGGRVYLVDFGLPASAQVTPTLSGGAHLYMAPEIHYQTAPYSAATDLHAVGLVMYQLFVGKHPFDTLSPEQLGDPLGAEYAIDGAQGLDTETAAFLQSLLQKAPAMRPQNGGQALAALQQARGLEQTEAAEIRESFLQVATFIGREQELGLLAHAIDQAQEGTSSLWLLGGESGVGKSRLLDEVRTIALVKGWQVWNGNAAESNTLPYQLWRDIAPRLALTTELTDLEASILKEITPDIDRLLNRQITVAPQVTGADNQDRLSLALVEAIRRQTQPTLILLEDLQWAREGFAPIKLLLNVLEQLPHVLVIATFRNDESPNLPAELPDAELIVLDRLNATEVTALSEAMLGELAIAPNIISLLAQETEGNTFFIVEVMRALAEEAGQLQDVGQMDLPTAVFTQGMEELLQRRIQKLPLADQPLLQMAAVAGRQLDLPLLATRTADKTTDGWLQRALDAAVLAVRDDQWFFAHDKLRQAILSDLAADSRQEHHRQVAIAIEQRYPNDPSYNQNLLEHWTQVGDIDKEIHYLEPVAQYLSQSISDFTQAEELLIQGLKKLSDEDPRRISLLNWQAFACLGQRNADKFEKAQLLAQQAQVLAEKYEDDAGLATSLHYLAVAKFELSGADQQAADYCQRSLTLARSIQDRYRIADNLILLGEIAHHHGDFDQAITYTKEGVATIEEIGSRYRLGHAYNQIGQAYLVKGDYEEATTHIKQSKGQSLELASVSRSILENHSPAIAGPEKALRVTPETKPEQRTATDPMRRIGEFVDQTIFVVEKPAPEDATRFQLDAATPILGRLLEISNRMAEIRALDPLLSYAINEVLNLVGAERGYIVLIDEKGELEYRIKQRADGTAITSQSDPISSSVLNEVVRTHEGIVIKNALLDPRFATALSVVNMRLRSIMCVPLITKDNIIGAIYVENRSRSGQFSDADLLPLNFFSNQAAISIENAFINDNLEKLVEERTRELAEAKDTAEAANEAKTSFLSNMSHELRTPLNSIINFTGFVFDRMFGEINEEQEEALEQVLDSGEHLLSLINDVLDINKIEAGMMQLIFEDIDVNKLVENTVATTKGLIKKKQLQLQIDVADDLPVIQADRRRARQILLNVIANAVKYTPEGYIRIEAKRYENDTILITIEDSGIGIAEEEQANVFETFVEARHNLTNVLSTGLGLPITKNLIELHNGRIWFDSEAGRGSAFYIQLPIQQL